MIRPTDVLASHDRRQHNLGAVALRRVHVGIEPQFDAVVVCLMMGGAADALLGCEARQERNGASDMICDRSLRRLVRV